MIQLGSKNTQHQYELELINPRFVVSHRPYEGLKLRAGFHTGDVIAGVQVQNFLFKKMFAKMLNINSSMLVLSVWGSRCLAIVSLAKLPSLRRF